MVVLAEVMLTAAAMVMATVIAIAMHLAIVEAVSKAMPIAAMFDLKALVVVVFDWAF